MKLTRRAVEVGAIAAPLNHVGGFGVGRFGVGGSNTTIGTRNFSCAAHWDFSDRLSGYKKAGREEFLALLKEQLEMAEKHLATNQSQSSQSTSGGGGGEGCSNGRTALEFLTPLTAVQFLRDHFEVQSSMKSVPSVCSWYVYQNKENVDTEVLEVFVLDKFPFVCGVVCSGPHRLLARHLAPPPSPRQVPSSTAPLSVAPISRRGALRCAKTRRGRP